MVELYRTDDIELAVRQALSVNRHVILNRNYRLRFNKHIAIAMKFLTDVPCIELVPRNKSYKNDLKLWYKTGGLGLYTNRADFRFDQKMPESDAVIYVEAPLSHTVFKTETQNIERQIIMYCPPSWKFHEETFKLNNTHFEYLEALYIVLRELMREAPSGLACEIARVYKREKAKVFEEKVLLGLLGVDAVSLQKLMRRAVGNMIWRVYCYTLALKPEGDEVLLKAYRYLEKLPDLGRGLRCIDDLKAEHRWVFRSIRVLLRKGYIIKQESFYASVWNGHEKDFTPYSAAMNVKLALWHRMRDAIDNAPPYLINPRIQSAQHVPTVCEGHLSDTVDSTPVKPTRGRRRLA